MHEEKERSGESVADDVEQGDGSKERRASGGLLLGATDVGDAQVAEKSVLCKPTAGLGVGTDDHNEVDELGSTMR